MVPWYQIVFDLGIAGALILTLIYAPVLRGRSLPFLLQTGMAVFACILIFGIIHATAFGHWPFR